jgi:hypothetical protein
VTEAVEVMEKHVAQRRHACLGKLQKGSFVKQIANDRRKNPTLECVVKLRVEMKLAIHVGDAGA